MKITLTKDPLGRQLVVGDIHGCYTTFYALVEEQLQLKQGDQLIVLGDAINKGSDSKKVLDYLMQLSLEHEVYCIKGNHEHNLLTAYSCGMDFFEDFLHTYCADDLMEGDLYAYLDFCAQMSYYIETPSHIFSHLGFSAAQPYPLTDMRAYFHDQQLLISNESIQNKKQVHGHIPIGIDQIQTVVAQEHRVINIDAGCCYKNKEMLGHLCALDVTSNTLYIQENLEKEAAPIAIKDGLVP